MSEALAGQALSNLVTQFSSAFDCLRELVQNSIDAGSNLIEVWTEFIPSDDAESTIAVHVDDTGEGMDDSIIDNELTKLFASSKENDLTKIGKFGIGFVSIFALSPRAVLLHTGRGGEFWELLFHEDRSFTKTRVEDPVEGTQITLFLAGDETRYDEIVIESLATLKRWCRHSDVEITFEDRSALVNLPCGRGPERINEPFALEGLVTAEASAEGTEIVLSYDRRPRYEFYNRGLTLAELTDRDQVPSRFHNISFKIKSRYLEHTLSRETVLKDENYEKAMSLVQAAADGPLSDRLLERMEQLVVASPFGMAQARDHEALADFLLQEPRTVLEKAAQRPILRSVDGGGLDLATVAKNAVQDGRIFVTSVPSALTEDLISQKIPVLLGNASDVRLGEDREGGQAYLSKSPILRLVVRYVASEMSTGLISRIRSLVGRTDYVGRAASMVTAPEDVYLKVKLDDPVPEEARRLIEAAERILAKVKADYRRMTGCVLPAAPERPPLFLVARRLGSLMAVPPAHLPEEKRPRRPEAAVNREHPHFKTLLSLSAAWPELGAYMLAKSLLLKEDRLLEQDLELMAAAFPEANALGSALFPPEEHR